MRLLLALLLLLTTSTVWAVTLSVEVPDQPASELVDFLTRDMANPPSTPLQKKTYVEEKVIAPYLRNLYLDMKQSIRLEAASAQADTDVDTDLGAGFGK